MEQFNVSERRVCRALGQPRSTQRYRPKIRDDEEWLIELMIELATKYGRYGYRRITALTRPPKTDPAAMLGSGSKTC